MILLCADIGCTVEPFPIFFNWSRNLYAEIIQHANPHLPVGDYLQGQERFLSTYAHDLYAELQAPAWFLPNATDGRLGWPGWHQESWTERLEVNKAHIGTQTAVDLKVKMHTNTHTHTYTHSHTHTHTNNNNKMIPQSPLPVLWPNSAVEIHKNSGVFGIAHALC
jgi:hypothetical protein